MTRRILIKIGGAQLEDPQALAELADSVASARRAGYELVIVSTRGRTGLAHVLIGSVAERVVRHSPVPVLVVR